MWLLAGGVALLVIAVSANLAGLMLARGAARRSELAIRAALGASRGQLAREVLLEVAVLVAAGTLLGVAASEWLLALILRFGPRDLPRVSLSSIDAAVVLTAFAAVATAAAAASLSPALQAGRGDAREAL